MARLPMVVLIACVCLVLGHGRLAAQSDGSGLVKLVVPYAPGGYPDTVGRLLAGQLTAASKQTYIVENRPGGAGAIAADAVAKSPPDGRTLLVADPQQWSVAPHLLKSATYDIERDFAPVTLLATTGNFLVVSASMPVAGFKDFAELVRTKPDAYNYGIPGVGSLHHLIMEVLLQRLGGRLTQIPFKGGGEVGFALANGQVQVAMQALAGIAARVKEGKVRILAVATAQRSPLAPDVPTMQELGVANMDFPGGLGILAPRQTPPEITVALARVMKEAIHAPALSDKLKALAVEPLGSPPDEFGRYIHAEFIRFGEAARSAGLQRE